LNDEDFGRSSNALDRIAELEQGLAFARVEDEMVRDDIGERITRDVLRQRELEARLALTNARREGHRRRTKRGDFVLRHVDVGRLDHLGARGSVRRDERILGEANTRPTFDEDIVTTVRKLGVIDDQPGAGNLGDARMTVYVCRFGAGDVGDRQRAVGRETVLHHRPIARLEDVKRHERAGEKHGGEREEREGIERRLELARRRALHDSYLGPSLAFVTKYFRDTANRSNFSRARAYSRDALARCCSLDRAHCLHRRAETGGGSSSNEPRDDDA
jgi:hypothetical protein